nr:immunoglobulin light chain junction region [Macaca mulatta]MOX78836.1 immunoglobulin light chain junction region [Macaca mulatta]
DYYCQSNDSGLSVLF